MFTWATRSAFLPPRRTARNSLNFFSVMLNSCTKSTPVGSTTGSASLPMMMPGSGNQNRIPSSTL